MHVVTNAATTTGDEAPIFVLRLLTCLMRVLYTSLWPKKRLRELFFEQPHAPSKNEIPTALG